MKNIAMVVVFICIFSVSYSFANPIATALQVANAVIQMSKVANLANNLNRIGAAQTNSNRIVVPDVARSDWDRIVVTDRAREDFARFIEDNAHNLGRRNLLNNENLESYGLEIVNSVILKRLEPLPFLEFRRIELARIDDTLIAKFAYERAVWNRQPTFTITSVADTTYVIGLDGKPYWKDSNSYGLSTNPQALAKVQEIWAFSYEQAVSDGRPTFTIASVAGTTYVIGLDGKPYWKDSNGYGLSTNPQAVAKAQEVRVEAFSSRFPRLASTATMPENIADLEGENVEEIDD